MAETVSKEVTNVAQIEVDDLNDILGIPGTDSILLQEEKKNNLFTRSNVDLSFINKSDKAEVKSETKEPDTTTETKEVVPTEEEKNAASKELKEALDELSNPDSEDSDEDSDDSKAGRPKLTKNGVIELTKKLIDKGLILPFEDDKAIEEYSLKDFEELIETNIQNREEQIRESTPVEFFDSLPDELKVAAAYYANGGTDMKSIFRSLAEVEETKALDPTVEADQEKIIREYLKVTNFGSIEEIDEEIDSLKDLDKLENRAVKFKSKLDAMSESRVSQKLAQQEALKKQQSAAAAVYADNVYKTLETGTLGTLKLDKKVQGMLYSGLIQPNYSSISGKPTNLLGHLLEKYQVVEPNHGLIAEALWLLADPDGYKSKLKDSGKQENVVETVRKLKTEESRKISSAAVIEKDEKKQRTIKRNDNFFKR